MKDNRRSINIGEDFRGIYSNVIETNRNVNNEFADIHSALMPIELADKIIKQFTCENNLIIDTFNGLGTTLMSCIKNNRRYYGIEIEPIYCEKTIERYLDFCIKPNVKIIRNGEVIAHDEIMKLCQKKQLNIFEF